VPGVGADGALAGADRIRAAAANLAREGSATRLLSTTFVPDEEWMFDLFEAEGATEVERVYARARVSVERISRTIHIQNGASNTSQPSGTAGFTTGSSGRPRCST